MRNHHQVILDYISNACYSNYLEKMLIQNNSKIIADYRTSVLQLVENCKNESNMDKKDCTFLYQINSISPETRPITDTIYTIITYKLLH